MDYDSVSRDAQAHSKELYTWGQTETDDLKDGKLHGLLTSSMTLTAVP